MPKDVLRIYSWNVNGIRSCVKQGFLEWLGKSRADIVGLQETRANVDQLEVEVTEPKRWATYFNSAERKGYSGVALYTRVDFDNVATSLKRKEFDVEGRLQIATLGEFTIVNCYFPNGSGKDRDNSRVPYKLDFYRSLYDRLEPLRKKDKPVIVIGDFNIAHHEIDLARPKSNQKTSGFLPEEREELSRWLDAGWTDTFRHFEKKPEHYTWWSRRAGARERNVGWRIDYVLASEAAMPYLKKSKIHPKVMGSDHCPISAEFDWGIVDKAR